MDRRTRKRLANRQLISDVATRLFMERGFDQVTVEQIAEAADVGRMTVFNHFPRKEDMFFDREHDARAMARAAIEGRDEGTSAIEALRLLAHRMIEDRHELMPLFGQARRFVETAVASEALRARARQMRDEFTSELSMTLAQASGQETKDSEAVLVATLLVATWSAAFAESFRVSALDGDEVAAGKMFLRLIDKGMSMIALQAPVSSAHQPEPPPSSS